MRNKTRFKSYFPVLYYFGEFSIIILATEIMLLLTYSSWSDLNTIFIVFWFLFSVSSNSHVLGRGIKNSKLVLSTFKTLFFFTGSVAILNMFFFNLQFLFFTITIAISLFYFLILFYRLFVNFVLANLKRISLCIMVMIEAIFSSRSSSTSPTVPALKKILVWPNRYRSGSI